MGIFVMFMFESGGEGTDTVYANKDERAKSMRRVWRK